MDIFKVLTMIGGLCLFLFGMNLMGQALERRAGGKLAAHVCNNTNLVLADNGHNCFHLFPPLFFGGQYLPIAVKSASIILICLRSGKTPETENLPNFTRRFR